MNLAPNGKPSNLTPEQYRLVRTPEFKKWFGDWEKSPETASKVVDENGEPLVLYHGSRSEFNVFDIKKSGESNSTAKVGFWFSPIRNFAENFASSIWYGKSEKEIIYSVFLSVKNPKIYETEIIDEEQKQELRLKIKELQNESLEIQKKWVAGDWDYNDRIALDYSIKGLINEENYEYYSKLSKKSKDAINDGVLIAEINKKKKNIENKLYGLTYTDSYEKYRTDIYKEEGKSSYEANTGGSGMALSDPSGTIEKYVSSLKNKEYDGIIIKNTRFDKSSAGGLNDQYVAFNSNQIKLADGTNTTFDANNNDVRYKQGANINTSKTMNSKKIVKVMREFRDGKLYTSAGDKVTDRKQALAIAISEAKRYEMKAGDDAEESVYIEYLNKDKKFQKDVKYFKSYEEALAWARKNFERFSPDMIKYKFKAGGEIEPHKEVKTDLDTVIDELHLSEYEKIVYEEFKNLSDDEIVDRAIKLSDKLQNEATTAKDSIDLLEDKQSDIDLEIDEITEDESISKKEISKKVKELEEEKKKIGLKIDKLSKYQAERDELSSDFYLIEVDSIPEIRKIIEKVDGRMQTRMNVKSGSDLFPEESNIKELVKEEKKTTEKKHEKVDVSKIKKKLDAYDKDAKAERSLLRDKERKALKPGKRVSKNGNVYYEYRENHSDKNPRVRLKNGANIETTNDGKQGGLVGGKKHSKGGVKTIVVDDGRPVEIEEGEVIITAPAVKKHWKELDAINQDGGGVPIHAPKMKEGGNADSAKHWYDGGNDDIRYKQGANINILAPKKLYRCTKTGMSFIEGGLGEHWGTENSAKERCETLTTLIKEDGLEVPHIISAKITLKKPLKCNDDIGWKDFKVTSKYLLKTKAVTKKEINNFSSLSELRLLLQKKGYDGIEYANLEEDKGNSSYIVFSKKSIEYTNDYDDKPSFFKKLADSAKHWYDGGNWLDNF